MDDKPSAYNQEIHNITKAEVDWSAKLPRKDIQDNKIYIEDLRVETTDRLLFLSFLNS